MRVISDPIEASVITGVQLDDHARARPDADYFLSPDVILVTVDDGSARLLDMTGSFHAISAVGARMLQAVLADGAAAAVPKIAEHYGVGRQQIEADLAIFLRDLMDRRLLCARGQQRAGGNSGIVARLMRLAVQSVHGLAGRPETKARFLLPLARLSFARLGWTRTVSIWRQAHGHFPSRTVGDADKETVDALDRTVRSAATGHPVTMMCKESALCSWSLARAAGLNAALVVGIDLFPIAGHCWCEVGTATPGDDPHRIERFAPVGRW